MQKKHSTWWGGDGFRTVPPGVLERLMVSPRYLTFYPGQRQVVAQAQPIQSAWIQSEERAGALRTGIGTNSVDWTERTWPDLIWAGHGWTEWPQQRLLPNTPHRDDRKEEENPRQSDSEERNWAAQRLHHHHRWDRKTRELLLGISSAFISQ